MRLYLLSSILGLTLLFRSPQTAICQSNIPESKVKNGGKKPSFTRFIRVVLKTVTATALAI
jgi:hypothetical protein